MSTGKRPYKLWQRDSSVPIPKRTLARLKKIASKEADVFSIDQDSSSSLADTEDVEQTDSIKYIQITDIKKKQVATKCLPNNGFSFGHGSDRDSVRSEDVDLLNESNHLSPVVNRAQFVPLYISWIAGFEALLIFVFEIMTFILADVLFVKDLGGKDPPFSFLALLHVLLWLFIMVCHFFLIYQHNRLQLRGYLTFCHQIKYLTILPPLVLSFGNAVLLAFFCIADYAWAETRFHHYYFFQLLYSVEFVIVLPALIYYIVKVVIFNKERALPDCYTLVDNNFRLDIEGEIGYSESRWPNGILEKQADMIRYLKQHNDNLSRRLLRQTQGT